MKSTWYAEGVRQMLSCSLPPSLHWSNQDTGTQQMLGQFVCFFFFLMVVFLCKSRKHSPLKLVLSISVATDPSSSHYWSRKISNFASLGLRGAYLSFVCMGKSGLWEMAQWVSFWQVEQGEGAKGAMENVSTFQDQAAGDRELQGHDWVVRALLHRALGFFQDHRHLKVSEP